MKYRSEIDGLRAIAVVPVILFHAGFEIFSGGFVGVDVFFVISGYLITTIIINEMDEGKFSLLNFYERRARRILPAMFFVVLCCLPFAWFLLMPSDMKDFSQSLVAVATFSSNILFWRESGYFDTAAELKPLLHTWSLAVEEQFYILFPLFLMAAWRFGKRAIVWTLIAAFVISLAMAQWGAYNKPAATFYLLPTRAWELLIGSFAAFYLQKRSVPAPLWVNNVLSAVGLAAILFGVFAFDDATPFPSVYALAPTVGTVLIILFAVRGTAIQALLSLKAFVSVGLISYSLYLWHQPVFAFWRHYNVFEPTNLQMALLSTLCLPLAYLTYRAIETPLRQRSTVTKQSQTLLVSAIILSFIGSFGLWGHLNVGFPSRLPPAVLTALNFRIGDTSLCHNGLEASEIAEGERCVIGPVGVTPSIAFIGDSHTARITDAIEFYLSDRHFSFLTFNGSWCVPLMHFRTNFIGKDGCIDEINAAFRQVAQDENIRSVVLFAEWANYVAGYRWPETSRAIYQFSASGDFDFENASVDDNRSHFEAALTYTLEFLENSGKDVIIVLPTPEFEFIVPRKMAHLIFNSVPLEDHYLSMDAYRLRSGAVRSILSTAGASSAATLIDPLDVLCELDFCPFDDYAGNPRYEDANHLSFVGALPLANLIVETVLSNR